MSTTAAPSGVHVRWMIRRDMPEVVEIERASFPEPWAEGDFLHALRARNCIGIVAEDRELRVVGYAVYELHARHLQVLNLAVSPAARGRGVGAALAGRLREKLRTHRRDRLVAWVGEANLTAQLWLSRRGFRCVRVIRGGDETADAYAMEISTD